MNFRSFDAAHGPLVALLRHADRLGNCPLVREDPEVTRASNRQD
jgi:hypothetical protein